MASLQCPECGKELLPTNPTANKESCICTQCERKVYGRPTNLKTPCPECGKENESTVTI